MIGLCFGGFYCVCFNSLVDFDPLVNMTCIVHCVISIPSIFSFYQESKTAGGSRSEMLRRGKYAGQSYMLEQDLFSIRATDTVLLICYECAISTRFCLQQVKIGQLMMQSFAVLVFTLYFNSVSICSQEVKEKRNVMDVPEHKKTSNAILSSVLILLHSLKCSPGCCLYQSMIHSHTHTHIDMHHS